MLLITLVAALVVMTLTAAADRRTESALAAGIFAVVLINTALRSNTPLWRPSPKAAAADVTPRGAFRQSALLVMLAYLWSALAFYAIYLGTHIRWQHGWEYGSAALLIAAGHAVYLWQTADPNSWLSSPRALAGTARLATLQAIAIACGLIWLLASGKLMTPKGDWAANQIFLAGGAAIMCLSIIAVRTYAVLRRRSAR
jgi:hypothetical protein